MEYFTAFEKREDLITQYGKNAAFVVWGMGLYLDDSDLQTLADESLTDCGDDKKIDFPNLDASGGQSCPKRLFLSLDVKIDSLQYIRNELNGIPNLV